MKKIIGQLHEYEKRILKALEKEEPLTIEQLEDSTGLAKDSLEKASLWAKLKKVIKIKEDFTEFLELTEEGEEYVKKGLPERNLLIMLGDKKRRMADLEIKVKNFPIALVWVRRNKWADIENGFLKITEGGRKVLAKRMPEEDALSKLSKSRKQVYEFDKDVVKRLMRRGLVKQKSEVKKEISLTDLGKKISPKIKIEEEIGQLTPKMLISRSWKKKKIRPYDISIPSSKVHPAKKHYMTQVIEYIRKIWLEMGFKEMTGPLLEVSFWNFDGLYQPQDHPARDLADTFYIKNPENGKLPKRDIVESVKATHEYGWNTGSTGWQYKWDEDFAKKCILRTHTTSLSARTLAALRDAELPAKFFSVGRCFRNETLDWKHLAEFYQTDGIVVGEDVTFRHLLGYLKRFFSKLGFPKARFRPAYFPYTEMSTEIEVFHPVHKEWIELGGAGIFRPEVVKPLLGKDVPVLAWGPGFGRIVMMHYKINDLRELYANNLKQLREAKMWLG